MGGSSNTPLVIGSSLSVRDSTELAALNPFGLTLGTLVFNQSLLNYFELVLSSAALITDQIVAVLGTSGVRWVRHNDTGQGVNTTVLYVSPAGNNADDGTSWFSPKKTVLSAYDALPIEGGTIQFETGANWSDGTEGGGISPGVPLSMWLVDGPVVPPGWRKYKPFTLFGLPSFNAGGFNTSGLASLGLDRQGDTRLLSPGIWLSGPCNHFHAENVFINGFPGTVRREGWDYPRNSDGSLIQSTVTSAVRTGTQTVLTLSTRSYPVATATRINGNTTIVIPGSACPQGSLPVSAASIITLTSTNSDYPSGTYTCLLVDHASGGGGVLTYPDPGPDKPVPESMTGSTFTTHGMGVNERLDLTSGDTAHFPSTMYRIVAADHTTVTVTDPYGSTHGGNQSSGAVTWSAAFQDRFNFSSYLYSYTNCFGQVGGNNAADVYWRGPACDLGTSNFGGFSVFEDGTSWVGYLQFYPNVSLDFDRVAAVLLDGGAQGSPVYCAQNVSNQQGAIRAYLGPTGVLVVQNSLTDVIGDGNTVGPPCVEVFFNAGANSTAIVDLTSVQGADNSGTVPNVLLHNSNPSSTRTRNCGYVKGACTSISDGTAQDWSNANRSSPVEGQIGFWAGDRIAGRHPATLLQHGPQTPRVRNFITGPSTWTLDNCTLSTGIAAPDGSNTAVRMVPTGGGVALAYLMFPSNNDPHTGSPLTQSVGDRWAYFLWAKKHSGSQPLAAFMAFAPSAPGALELTPSPDYFGDGGWQYYGQSGTVAVLPGAGASAQMSVQVSIGDVPTQYDLWGATVLRVPAGALTDDEFAQIVMTLRNLPYYLTPGNCGTMEGQKLIGHGGLGIDASVPKVAGVGSGQLTVGAITTYEPRYAADGVTIIGWAALFAATVNP